MAGFDRLEFAGRLKMFFDCKERIVWEHYRNSGNIEKKSGDELVGELDKIMEKELEIFLTKLKKYPTDGTHNFLGENPNFGFLFFFFLFLFFSFFFRGLK